MPADTSSVFTQAIQEHLELKRRNAALETQMPIQRYVAEDPFENHPLFKTEEQARIEETLDGLEAPFADDEDSFVLSRDDVVAHGMPEFGEGLWTRSRDFDWGD